MFINKKAKNKGITGFTLIEVLVSMAIFAFLSLLIMKSFSDTILYSNAISEESALGSQLQYTMDYIIKMVRNSSYLNLTKVNQAICTSGCPDSTMSFSSTPLILYNSQGIPYANISVSQMGVNSIGMPIYSIQYNANSQPSVSLTNSPIMNIVQVKFLYDNFDSTGNVPSPSPQVYTTPYLTIALEACSSKPVYPDNKPVCINLINQATIENYSYGSGNNP